MRFITVAVWFAILAVVSLLPDDVKYHLGTKGSSHFAAHFFVFALSAVLFCWKRSTFRSRLTWALGACFAVFALEWLEAASYHNPIEWLDVWTGCLGVASGLILTTIIQGTPVPARFVRK